MAIPDEDLLRRFFDEETMTPSTIGALGREVISLRSKLTAMRDRADAYCVQRNEARDWLNQIHKHITDYGALEEGDELLRKLIQWANHAPAGTAKNFGV